MLYYSIFIRNNVGERKESKVGREKEGIVEVICFLKRTAVLETVY